MKDYTVNKILTGDIGEAQRWLPFAKSNLDNFRQQVNYSNHGIMNPVLQKIIKNDNQASIRLLTDGKNLNKIFIEGKLIACPNYLNGLILDSFINNDGKLVQYYPSSQYTDRSYVNSPTLAVKLSDYYNIANNAGDSQHVHIKASMFSGDIRYLVQELLGMKQQIKLDYRAERCHGFIYRNRVAPTLNPNSTVKSVTEYPSNFLIEINTTGLYVKKVKTCQRSIDKNHNYPDSQFGQQIIAPQIVPQFNSFSDDITSEIASGTVTQLLDASQLAPFYANEVLFPEQGWLFQYALLEKRNYDLVNENGEVTDSKQYLENVDTEFYISNTCYNSSLNRVELWKIQINLTINPDDHITLIPTSANIVKNFYNLYCPFTNKLINVPDYLSGFSYSPNLMSNVIPVTNYVCPLYMVSANPTVSSNPYSALDRSMMVIPPIDKNGNATSWPPENDTNFNLILEKDASYILQSVYPALSYTKTLLQNPDGVDGEYYRYTINVQESCYLIPQYERESFILFSKPYIRTMDYDFDSQQYVVTKTQNDYTNLASGGLVIYYGRYGRGDGGDGVGDARFGQLNSSFSNVYYNINPKNSNVFYCKNINDVFDPLYAQFFPSTKSFNYLDINVTVYKNNLTDYVLPAGPLNNLSFIGKPNNN